MSLRAKRSNPQKLLGDCFVIPIKSIGIPRNDSLSGVFQRELNMKPFKVKNFAYGS